MHEVRGQDGTLMFDMVVLCCLVVRFVLDKGLLVVDCGMLNCGRTAFL